MVDLIVAAYWGPRRESAAQCTERVGGFLQALSKQDKLLSRWYLQCGRTGISELGFRAKDRLRKAVEDAPHRDSDGKPIPDLGFLLVLWNGQDHPWGARLSITCGLHTQNPNLSNVVVLDPPPGLPGLGDPQKMTGILATIVSHWEPDWGGVISAASRDARHLSPGGPYVDWVFYGSNRFVPMGPIPPPASVRPVRGFGNIVLVQPRPVDASKPDDLARIESVEAALGVDRLRNLELQKLDAFRQRAELEYLQRRTMPLPFPASTVELIEKVGWETRFVSEFGNVVACLQEKHGKKVVEKEIKELFELDAKSGQMKLTEKGKEIALAIIGPPPAPGV